MTQDRRSSRLSLNERAAALVDRMIADAALLRVGVRIGTEGETLVDCGHRSRGSTEAGLRLARIATGGLAEVSMAASPEGSMGWDVLVRTSQPLLACLGCQYAGWHLKSPTGAVLMGSGPARLLARHEAILDGIAHHEVADRAVLLVEGDAPPDCAIAQSVAEACGIARDRLVLLHSPTGSLTGMTQVAARVVECAMQKLRLAEFPPDAIIEATGSAPIRPPHPDTRIAMGRANDAIIYGGQVHLVVEGSDDEAQRLATALPSSTSSDWGRSFAQVYEAAGGDFSGIDSGLFSPALVTVTAVESGETFSAGRKQPEWLTDH
ncbi:methenyltetrahydromethanopterin cyclohydrolase [Rubellimicrobium rubrum]|uniref:Methenyltetrahydromethanopterin cyclohydrolase n=1 Tax=Rubellimicrobium rubrum TaxID=2585369 RepID=A0A5C4N236_9RHOB|nr:methenyltetrahydromethanopterin cyclohydrolase [Rubellimicrobium rubrum]TNC50859.1 methenyltetrahydromethanopterin cyclohydrolase [Rubellimicrobium rubrum]